jgi:hypothetical protein
LTLPQRRENCRKEPFLRSKQSQTRYAENNLQEKEPLREMVSVQSPMVTRSTVSNLQEKTPSEKKLLLQSQKGETEDTLEEITIRDRTLIQERMHSERKPAVSWLSLILSYTGENFLEKEKHSSFSLKQSLNGKTKNLICYAGSKQTSFLKLYYFKKYQE